MWSKTRQILESRLVTLDLVLNVFPSFSLPFIPLDNAVSFRILDSAR